MPSSAKDERVTMTNSQADVMSAVELEQSVAASLESESLDPELAEAVTVATEKLQGRQRRILASIWIPRSVEQVWNILTDYEHLADFIPNLTESRLLPSENGTIRLEQIGAQCWLNLKFCARVVLQMEETFPQAIAFAMVEGDFKEFHGAWQLETEEREGQAGTLLHYSVEILPRRTMPIGLVEKHLSRNLIMNMAAIFQQSVQRFAVA